MIHDDLVAGTAMDAKRYLIAHDAGGKEQGIFRAQKITDHFDEPIDGRIFPLLFITHFRHTHEFSHCGRRPGKGVTVKINTYILYDFHLFSL